MTRPKSPERLRVGMVAPPWFELPPSGYGGIEAMVYWLTAGLVAISEQQRKLAPDLRWVGTVDNAIPLAEYPFRADKEDFCLFLGRINDEKAPDLAIRAAREAGQRIVLAAKCSEPHEQRYFEERVQPLLGPDAEWLGQAGNEEKQDLLARARRLVAG